jgi:hypothetical protein
MTYANIELKEHDRWGNGHVKSTIDPFIKEFIEQLALKYPQWTFVENGVTSNGSTNTYEAHSFKVMDKREVLGILSKEWASGGARYCVDNHRIASMRERGSGMKTIHMDKAIKHVNKLFGRKNANEKFTEARQVIVTTLGHVHNQKRWDLSHKWDKVQSHAQKFVIENYAQFSSGVTDTTNTVGTSLEQFPSCYAEFNSVDAMQDALQKGDAYLVFIDGLNYSVQKGKDPLEVKASEELPDFMRRAVGLLKLVEDNQVIAGVGVRANETTFLVMPNNVS